MTPAPEIRRQRQPVSTGQREDKALKGRADAAPCAARSATRTTTAHWRRPMAHNDIKVIRDRRSVKDGCIPDKIGSQNAARITKEAMAPSITPKGSVSMKVLYLDDDAQLSFLLARALTACGHSITTANDATMALKAYAKEPQCFDLVITDMSMFSMSGLEFAQEVLKLNPAAKVIILSGCEHPNWADYARSCGVREVMEKSVSIEAMAAALDSRLRG
jgi:CheY-like chemotaxis protein